MQIVLALFLSLICYSETTEQYVVQHTPLDQFFQGGIIVNEQKR